MMPRSPPNINSDGIPDRRLRDYSMTLVDSGAQCARYDQAKGSTPIVGLFGYCAKFTSGQTPDRRGHDKATNSRRLTRRRPFAPLRARPLTPTKRGGSPLA